MACGTPVIAFGKGGALDYIKPGTNGLFFNKQTPASLIEAMDSLDPSDYDPNVVKNTTREFDKNIFKTKIKELIRAKVKKI